MNYNYSHTISICIKVITYNKKIINLCGKENTMINISMNTKPPTSLGGKKVTPQPEVIEEVVEEEPQLTAYQRKAQERLESMQQSQQRRTSIQQEQANSVKLQRGQKTNLTQGQVALTHLAIGLGWDSEHVDYDLDASVFGLGADELILGEEWFIFYGQPESPDGCIRYGGDNVTGDGEGDDEVIEIELAGIDDDIQKLVVTITLTTPGVSLSDIENSYMRIVNADTHKEVFKFELGQVGDVRSLVVAEIYRYKGQWRVNPVGQGYDKELADFCQIYGIELED